MSRKAKKSRHRGLSRLNKLEIQVKPQTGRVEVAPMMASDLVKGPKLERMVFAKPKFERVKVGHGLLAGKPTMAETVASIAVRRGTKVHIEPLANMLMVATGEPKTIQLLGKLVVASTISSSKTLPQAMAMGDRFIESIANRPFEVEFSASGEATTRIGNSRTPRAGMKSKGSGFRVEVDDNVTVRRQNGNTTYIFNNLNVYITGDYIQQVNVNPENVINNITRELTSAIKKKAVKGKSSGKTHGLVLGKYDEDDIKSDVETQEESDETMEEHSAEEDTEQVEEDEEGKEDEQDGEKTPES